MSNKMTKAERETFLTERHVGIFSVTAPDRGPVTVPIWYTYEPGGEITFCTQSTSTKTKLMEAAGRFSMCVQSEEPPYKYVAVEGPILIMEPCDYDRDLRPIACHYLGQEAGDEYTDGAKVRGGSLTVRMRPERWSTVDYSKG